MGRVLKFRAWDSDDQTMIVFDEENYAFKDGHEKLGAFLSDHFGCELQQFTGLLDSKGVEIYEGDVVRWDDASGGKYWRAAEVAWSRKGSWCYRIIPSRCIGCFESGRGHDFMLGNFIYTPDPSLYGNVLEVIGNRFQHPELLD